VLEVTTAVAPNDPATGWLVLGTNNQAPTTDELWAYRVMRSSTFAGSYLPVLVVAIVAGLVAALASKQGLPGEKPDHSYLAVPEKHPLRGSWVSAVSAASAVATTVLVASGVLTEFVPQYQVNGVVAGNIVVLFLLALAPAMVAAGSDRELTKLHRTGALAAVGVTVVAVVAQLELVTLVVMHGAPRPGQIAALLAVALLTVLLIVSAWRLASDLTWKAEPEGQGTTR
jgi:hypothetical protein